MKKKLLLVYSLNFIPTAKAHELQAWLHVRGFDVFILGAESEQDIRLWDLDALEPGEFGVLKQMLSEELERIQHATQL